jgi:thiol-disulfide isomerase/thioredoxin
LRDIPDLTVYPRWFPYTGKSKEENNMAEQTSVVTPERYASGFTYSDYIAQIKVNHDKFQEYTETSTDVLNADDVAFFTKAAQSGAAKMLVVGEDWCPDVYRGLPVFTRIAKAAGIELRVFPRDENLDIADEFLNRGEFRSIPTVIFYTAAGVYQCHWIEKPAIGYQETEQFIEEARKELPAGTEEAEVRKVSRPRLVERYPAWQRATVEEIRAMLADKLGI